MNINYEEWIKLLKHPMNINWNEPLTEEEKIKVCSQLPRIAKILEHEQKELRLMKKISDKIEREAGAKDTELSKERLRMRLRMKLQDRKDAKAKEKESRKLSCSKDCEKCQRKRAKKMLAAKKAFDDAKSKDPEFTEEQQQNPEGEIDLLQYREPDKGNNDDEKEEDVQNDEAEEDNFNEDDGEELGAVACAMPQCYEAEEDNFNEEDGEELGAVACAVPQCYFLPYKDSDLSENHQLEMQEGVDQVGNVAEGRRFNLPPHRFDYDRNCCEKGEEFKSDQDDIDEAVQGLMKLLEMSEEPEQSASFSDFSKFLNFQYKF